ncbi:MAG: NUDIX hydrolase [Sphingomicrobium sp.]
MRQVAAFPYRHAGGSAGTIEILLVTSSSDSWIIPKGDVDGGMPPHRAAEKEAFEEGGVRGQIGDQPIGTFRTRKQQDGAAIPMEVDVFPLEVTEELERWPEMEQRERRWLALDEAAETVREPGLREIISAFRP